MQKWLLLIIVLSINQFSLCAQSTIFTDNFNDGTFITNSAWNGQNNQGATDPTTIWEVTADPFRLKSKDLSSGSGTRISYLSTSFSTPLNTIDKGYKWKFKMKVGFTVSASLSPTNNARVYLFSNNANLNEDLNGYYIQLREERITLIRQTGGSSSTLNLDGAAVNITAESEVAVEVRRTKEGKWEVFVNEVLQGVVTDANHTAANHIGVQIRYSSAGRSGGFTFDDFLVEELPIDTSVISIVSARQIGQNSIGITFNQALNTITAAATGNYRGNFNLIIPIRANINSSNPNEAIIEFQNLSNLNYTFTVNGVTNITGNAIANNLTFSLKISKTFTAESIIINEIMADPTPVVGLAEEEYLELYNTSALPIDLKGFVIAGYGGTLNTFVLNAGAYVVLTKSLGIFSADILVVGSGSLTNDGELLQLVDDQGNVIDEVDYKSSWYTPDFAGDGRSLEKINPKLECSGPANWATSQSTTGGTPGAKNSIFNDTKDAIPPRVISFAVTNPTTISLGLSEAVKATDITVSDFSFAGGTPAISTASLPSALSNLITITTNASLVSETNYSFTIRNIPDCEGNVAADTTVNFYNDITPPRLLDITIRSSKQIELLFNEALRSTSSGVSAYRINDTIPPTSRVLNDKTVTLNFANSFVLDRNYTLKVSGIEDLALNKVNPAIEQTFTYQDDIQSVTVVSANTLDVLFKKAVNQTRAKEVKNYIVTGEGSPILSDLFPENSSKVRLVFENGLPENKLVELFISNMTDANGGRMVTPTRAFEYDTKAPVPQSIKVLNANQLQVSFSEALEPTTSEISNNYTVNVAAQSAKLLSDQKTVLLQFDNNFEQEVTKRLSVNGIRDTKGNIMPRAINLNFIYDTLAPRITSAQHFSPKEIEIVFSETVDSLAAINRNNFTLGAITPATSNRLAYSLNTVRLVFANDIDALDSISLTIRNIKDLLGNTLKGSVVIPLDTKRPQLTSYHFENDSTIEVSFSRNVQLTDTTQIVISGASIKNTSVSSNKITITVTQAFQDKQVYMLTTKNIVGANNTLAVDYSGEVRFDSFYKSLAIVDPRIIEITFENALGSVATSNFKLGITINGITQMMPDKKAVKLFLDKPLEEGKQYTVAWTGLKDDFGRPLINYSSSFTFDKNAPTVTSVKQLLTKQIIITFSEKIDAATALAFNHYTLDSIPINPIGTTLLSDTSVMLTFDKPFKDKKTYQLNIKRIIDISGNQLVEATFDYTYIEPYKAQPGDLVFNEIMADPDPSQGLPNAEYIEIHNTSQEKINLFNVTFSDNLSNQLLGNFEINPGEYVIICDDSHELAFKAYGKVLALNTFPSLGNTEDRLSLKVEGRLIDSVSYLTSWYRSTTKDDGGFSLERIGLINGCAVSTNWIAAYDSIGGTPGKINSATISYKDETLPSVTALILSDRNTVKVTFSEAIDPSTISAENFIFDKSIAKIELSKANDNATITLAENVERGVIYRISVVDIKDCSGNAMSSISFEVGIGEKPKFNQIVISEIMADPEPAVGLPEAEYIEIYNPTDLLLSTENMVFADNTSVVNLPRFNIKPGEYIMLCPTASVPELSKIGKTIGVPSWPTLNNTGETLSFRIFESLIFSVSFKTEWYKTAAKAEGGYSLEMIDPNNPCGEATNWSASNAAVGGTPGKVNSINAVNPDNLGPTIAQTVTSGANGVILYFNEKLTPELPLGNFTFEPNLTKKEVFLSADYKSIQVYFNESLQSNLKYTITAKGVRDCVGNVTENGTKSSFVLPVIAEKGGLLINEVLFNPRTGGSDFVEFYNPTQNYYNLKGWTTTNNPSGTDFKSITSDNLIIEPGKFLVLSPAPANIISNYPLGDASTYLTTTLPTMSDSEGRIAIKRADGLIIDDFSYSDDYHNRLLKDDEGVSLERVSLTAPTDDRNNWQSAASDVGYATPGRANSQARTVSGTLQSISIEPKVFVPGGNISFTTISYKDDNAGSFASFLIYDSRGQLVRTLTENQLLAANGFLTWDGTNNEGSKVNVGIYILVVELFNSSGIVEVLKETVVVGGSF